MVYFLFELPVLCFDRNSGCVGLGMRTVRISAIFVNFIFEFDFEFESECANLL